MTRLAFVSPSGSVLSNFESLRPVLNGATRDITIVVWEGAPAPVGTTVIALKNDAAGTQWGPIARFLKQKLGGSVIGRNLLRISPWDGGRTLWRAVRKDSRATAALRAADVIVAVERDAILTAWKTARNAAPGVLAAYGLAAGMACLSEDSD